MIIAQRESRISQLELFEEYDKIHQKIINESEEASINLGFKSKREFAVFKTLETIINCDVKDVTKSLFDAFKDELSISNWYNQSVDFYEGVIFKSPPIDEDKAKELIYKKGIWIFEKLKLVERQPQGDIVTGSIILYLGKRYYVQLIQDTAIKDALIKFNQSKFKIYILILMCLIENY